MRFGMRTMACTTVRIKSASRTSRQIMMGSAIHGCCQARVTNATTPISSPMLMTECVTGVRHGVGGQARAHLCRVRAERDGSTEQRGCNACFRAQVTGCLGRPGARLPWGG